MNEVSPAEELARLRQLVKSLESGTKIIRAGIDVTQHELDILKLEIAYLEKIAEGAGSKD